MRNYINMSRPNAVYLGGLAVLMVTSLLLSNLHGYNAKDYLPGQYLSWIAGAFFGVGGMFGLIALLRHMGRVKEPWKVPQSQVSISYLLFFFLVLVGIVLSH